MADSLANLKISLSYPGPGGGTVSEPQISINAPFKASAVGSVDVPDSEAASTEHAITFGSVGTGATLAIIKNDTGQELDVKLNGAVSSVGIADGAVAVISQDALPAATPLTALAVVTTAEQSGHGTVGYWVFGDPEPAP